MQCNLQTEQVRRVPERAYNGKMMRLKCKINQWYNEQPYFNNYNLLCSKLSQPLSPVAARSYREAHLPCLNFLIPSHGWNSDLHLSHVVCVWHGGGGVGSALVPYSVPDSGSNPVGIHTRPFPSGPAYPLPSGAKPGRQSELLAADTDRSVSAKT